MDPDKNNTKSSNKSKFNIFTRPSDLIQKVSQVGLNTIIIAVISTIFQIVLSRKLGPSEYGEIETLLTINQTILISLAAIGFIVTKFIAYYKTRQQYDKMKFLANWAFIIAFILGMGAFIINILFSSIIAKFLNINDFLIIIVFGLLIWISFLIPIIEGILRGLQEFKFIGYYKSLDAILKLVLVLIIIFIGLKIKSIIFGLVVASVITIIFSGYILKKMYITRPQKINLKEIYLFSIPMFISFFILTILMNIDLILVKHFFDAGSAGVFAAAGILAKISLAVGLGVASVMFPKIVEYYSNGQNSASINTLKKSLKIVLFICIIPTLFIALFPEFFSKLLFGKEYMLGSALSIYIIATIILAISTVIILYDLAVKKYSFIPVLFAGAFIEIYQINKLHNNLSNIVWTLLVINSIILLSLIILHRKELFKYRE